LRVNFSNTSLSNFLKKYFAVLRFELSLTLARQAL
jgi:hypothetical protein